MDERSGLGAGGSESASSEGRTSLDTSAPGSETLSGTLYVVSTPIGNLRDMSFRAVDVLRSAAAVLAEDTRHTRRLLDHYEIRTPATAYHEHNEAKATPALVARLVAGESLALVTDAGTPLLSDPGARLVAAAIAAGVSVAPVPGASALLAALVAAGLDATRFTFFGFLARKGRERAEALREIAALRHTAVLYEAPSRVAATLRELAQGSAPDRQAAVARELTKQYEDIRRGTLADLATYYGGSAPRGEVVIVVAARGDAEVVSDDMLVARARRLRDEGVTSRDIARRLNEEFDVSRNAAYRAAQQSERGAGNDGCDQA